MGNICISKIKVEPNIIRKSNRDISIRKSERFYRSAKDPKKVHFQEKNVLCSDSDLVNIQPIRHVNQIYSVGSDSSFDIHSPCINLGESPSESFMNIPPNDRGVRRNISRDPPVQSTYGSSLNIPELTDTVSSIGKNNPIPIHIFDEDDEFIQALKIALMRTKIAIDTCTYDESRPKFNSYSMVPFIDIFH